MALSVSLDTYQYDDLSQGNNANVGPLIRYLVLHPGSDDDPLGCSLHTAPMTETEYEAVSK